MKLAPLPKLTIVLCFALLTAASAASAIAAQPAAIVSPQVNPDRSVTFRLARADAHDVLVALAGLETPLKMTLSNDVWSATSAPLESGTYWYSYLVDGREELDPVNPSTMPSYAFLNSVVRVPGPGKEPWDRADVPHGAVHRHFYESKLVKGLPEGRSEYFVYTPPGYESHPSQTYPTLYLLHGLSEGAADWTAMGGANFILDNMIAAGKAKPMVVVMPLGYGDMAVAGESPSADTSFAQLFNASSILFDDVLLHEILPRVEQDYRVSRSRDARAIAGLSMGGFESLIAAFNRPGKDGASQFAWVGSFSTPAMFLPPLEAKAQTAKLRLLWIACGAGDSLLEPNRNLVKELVARGYAVKAVETPGAHIWPVWQRNLADFAQLLF